MKTRNKYFPYGSPWTQDDWGAFCPNLTYRVIGPAEFPSFLPSGLTSQFNCAVMMASGSDTNQTYVLQGYRVDGTEIDEHQYIVTYDLQKRQSFAGFVEHAHYDGRTTDIPAEMKSSMSLSGINIDYQFPRKPPQPSGSISALVSAGLISGFVNSIAVQNKNENRA
jgi:hypothetical protein